MDRYTLLAIIVIVLIVSISFVRLPGDDEIEIIGFADNISESKSGFIFYIHQDNGKDIRSFCSERPDGSIHSFIGSYSDDGNIFFVSEIRDY